MYKHNHVFKDGASFAQAYGMYCFDRDLRQLIVKELEKIEISIRAKMIYVFSHQFGPPWYTNPEYFKKPHIHNDTLEKKIRTEFNRIDAQFIQAFKHKYSDRFPLLGLHLRLFHLEQFHDYFQIQSLGKVNGSLQISLD